MMRTLARGIAAGAAGTTALNAATYADMALRGRPSSSTPEQTVEALARKADVDIPGKDEARAARLTGLGALNGIAVGVAVGAVVSTARRAGLRLPVWAGTLLTAGLAMAASDLPMARLGVSDPRKWSPADWAADALPHLAYGAVTYGALASSGRT